MLAWTGFVATDLGFTLPGDMHQVSSVLAHDVACKYGAMQQLFLWLSFTEVILSAGVAQMMWMGSPREPGPVFGDEEMWVEAFKVNRLREVEAQEREHFLPQGAGGGAAGGGGKPGEQPSQESAASA